MEATGGEPDVTHVEPKTGMVTFTDCSPESPAGRRSLCYDRAALDARKEAKPAGSAVETAAAMGAELLTEASSESATGPAGFLSRAGLVSLPPAERVTQRSIAERMSTMSLN